MRLIGVVKTVAADVVREAVASGLEDLGENRVQEAEAKIAAVEARYAAYRAELDRAYPVLAAFSDLDDLEVIAEGPSSEAAMRA